MAHEYTKEEFRKSVKVGIDYAVESELDEEQMVTYLTEHLWGSVGQAIHNAKQMDNREYTYNEPARVDEDASEIEGQIPHIGIDEIDEHEGIGTSIFPDSKLNS